jgi:hypothetical protein
MAKFTMVNTEMASEMGWGNRFTRTTTCMKENGRMTRSMARVS